MGIKTHFIILVTAGTLLFGNVSSHAALLHVEGTFSATFSNPENDFSGSFSFVFDDSVVNPSGIRTYERDLLTFSFSPNPFDTRTFDLTNVGVRIDYYNGEMINYIIGGTPNGITAFGSGTNDFRVQYRTPLTRVYAAGASNVGAVNANSVSGTATITIVPEPGTASMLAAGGLAVFLRRRVRVTG